MSDFSTRVVALTGPSHLGKKTFAVQYLEDQIGGADFLAVESSVDGARVSREFLSTAPTFGSRRAVLVNDADLMSDGAQDAYLKLCEEPPAHSLIVLVAEDEGIFSEALRSRLQNVIRWRRLQEPEFTSCLEFMEAPLVSHRLCDGRPGLASTIASGSFNALYDSVTSIVSTGCNVLGEQVPQVIDEMKGERSPIRTAASFVIRSAALSSVNRPFSSIAFLDLASTLLKIPSANAEVHWFRACLRSMDVK